MRFYKRRKPFRNCGRLQTREMQTVQPAVDVRGCQWVWVDVDGCDETVVDVG